MAHKVAPETDTEVWQIDMRPQIYAFEKLTIEEAKRWEDNWGLRPDCITKSGYLIKKDARVEYIPYAVDPKSTTKELQYVSPRLMQMICKQLFTMRPGETETTIDDGAVVIRTHHLPEEGGLLIVVSVIFTKSQHTANIIRRVTYRGPYDKPQVP